MFGWPNQTLGIFSLTSDRRGKGNLSPRWTEAHRDFLPLSIHVYV